MYNAIHMHDKDYQEYRKNEYSEFKNTGVIQFDSENRIKNMNEEAERICGVDSSQVIGGCGEKELRFLGKRFWDMMAPEKRQDFKELAIKIRRHDVDMYVQVNVLHIVRGGLKQAGTTSVVLLQDISAIKMTLKQIQTTGMLVALGDLVSGFAHHIRTPLTTLSGYLQLMIQRAVNDKYVVKTEILEGLLNDVSYINNVIKELLIFVKPSLRKKAGVDVNDVLNEATLLTLKDTDLQKIEFDRQFMEKMPPIRADRAMLLQAFIHILSNAVEAMPKGGKLMTRIWRNNSNNMIVVGIEDTGGGIETEILPRVLEPFYTTKNDRMGLGLPIAYRIVAGHGGFLNVLPTAYGTRVNIYLPIFHEAESCGRFLEQQVLNLQ